MPCLQPQPLRPPLLRLLLLLLQAVYERQAPHGALEALLQEVQEARQGPAEASQWEEGEPERELPPMAGRPLPQTSYKHKESTRSVKSGGCRRN